MNFKTANQSIVTYDVGLLMDDKEILIKVPVVLFKEIKPIERAR